MAFVQQQYVGCVRSAVTEEDRAYMRQALQLAERGLGQTYPNPAVGCVIVKNGKVGHDDSAQSFVKPVTCGFQVGNLCCGPTLSEPGAHAMVW